MTGPFDAPAIVIYGVVFWPLWLLLLAWACSVAAVWWWAGRGQRR